VKLGPLGHECLTSHLRENVKCQLWATHNHDKMPHRTYAVLSGLFAVQ